MDNSKEQHNIQCYNCKSSNCKIIHKGTRDNSNIDVLCCKECGLVFLSDNTHISENFYEEGGMLAGKINLENWIRNTEPDDKRRFSMLENSIKDKVITDFGCGNAGFLNLAKNFAKKVYGVELQKDFVSYFKDCGLDIFQNIYEIPEKSDVITMFHVLEHIKDPVSALIWFFAAVIMVIVATYLLFIAGSVAVCRILQRKKKYYYKTNHFVSVSSMVYRMKRNGAGLASICILCTMVLVMASATVCLYVGTEDSLRARYPRNINLDTRVSDPALLDSEKIIAVRSLSAKTASANGQEPTNILDYRVAGFPGYVQDGRIETNDSILNSFQLFAYSQVWQIFIVPLDDYNRLMGQNETLAPGEALLFTTKMEKYTKDTIAIGDQAPFKVKKIVSDFLAKDGRFALVPMQKVLAESKVALEMGDFLKLLPNRHQTDGFFAAVLERKQ